MKKILFTILAVAAMSAACTKFADEVTPVYDVVGKPVVEANVADDDSITVVITAGENTSYYGYVVVKGVLEDVKASSLVADAYSKVALVQGEAQTPQSASIKYSEETKSVTLQLEGLVPFTDYTVYAAATSPMGVLSDVVAVTVKTSDGTEPVVDPVSADFEAADSVLTFAIPFSDPISLTGEGTVTADFYAENYYDAQYCLSVYKTVEIPAEYLSAEGKKLVVSIPAQEYIPGAYVSVTFTENLVVNGAGSKNVAFDKNLMAWVEGELLWNGIVGQYDYVNWDMSLVDPATLPDGPEGEGEMEDDEEEEEKEPVYFSDWTQLVMTVYSMSEYPLAGKTGDDEVTIVNTEGNGRSVSYTASKYAVMTANTAGVMLSEAPAYGSTISFTIAEGSFCDIFGNVNNEFVAEDEYFCSYGYTLDDIVGAYEFTAASAYDGSAQAGTVTIAASDNPEKGNVMFTEMFSTECAPNVYATFDMVAGVLTIPSQQVYSQSEKYLFAFCSSDSSGNIAQNPVSFSVPQAGVVAGQSSLFGDAAFDPNTGAPLGFFEIYYGFEAVRK